MKKKNQPYSKLVSIIKKSQWILIPGVIVVLVIVIAVSSISKQYIVQQAEFRIRDVMMEAEALHHYVQRSMHPTMYQLKAEGRMPENFYSPEVLSSSYISRHVFALFNNIRTAEELPNVKYKIAASNPRNKINQANDFEKELIQMFNNDSTIKKYSGVVDIQGVKHLYYAKPFLRVKGHCLNCHGKRENAPYELRSYYKWESGFDWQEGIIPAVELIQTPLVGEYDTSLKVVVGILFIALILLLLLVLYARKTMDNEVIKEQKNQIEETYSRLKEAQAKLLHTEKMASLGVLTAGVAHEINNPLNFISGGYAGIKSYLDGDCSITKEDLSVLLNSIEQGLARATNIVNGLNQFSRNNSSLIEDCNIHEIIDNCLVMLNNQLKHHVKLKKNYSTDVIKIKGNVGMLHQVFLNVLLNSCQAIKEKGEINIVTLKDEKQVTIIISDTGCGISKENINKVFDPFFTTKDPGDGTGMGMSISYNIIKEHKGDIRYESEGDQGTRVTISLPIQH